MECPPVSPRADEGCPEATAECRLWSVNRQTEKSGLLTLHTSKEDLSQSPLQRRNSHKIPTVEKKLSYQKHWPTGHSNVDVLESLMEVTAPLSVPLLKQIIQSPY